MRLRVRIVRDRGFGRGALATSGQTTARLAARGHGQFHSVNLRTPYQSEHWAGACRR